MVFACRRPLSLRYRRPLPHHACHELLRLHAPLLWRFVLCWPHRRSRATHGSASHRRISRVHAAPPSS